MAKVDGCSSVSMLGLQMSLQSLRPCLNANQGWLPNGLTDFQVTLSHLNE